MSQSYADAAASSGPVGAGKIPKPAEVETNGTPSGSVETVSEEELQQLKLDAKRHANKAKEVAKEQIGDFRKEIDEIERNSKSYWNQFISYVKSTYADASDYVNKNVDTSYLVKAQEELKNPVVLSQIVVGLGGIAAGYFTYLERYRIRTDNKVVLATHGVVLTGLIALDGFLFNKYYPKYKKN